MPLLNIVLASLLAAVGPGAPDAAADASRPDRVQRLAQGLRTSGSARERALGSMMYAGDGGDAAANRGRVLREAAQAAGGDVLVQQLWANSSEGWDGCSQSAPCPERRHAHARLEPGNGLAWTPAFAGVDPEKEAAAFDAVLERMAGAERFDDHYAEFVQAWFEVFAVSQPRNEALVSAVAQSAAMTVDWVTLMHGCDSERHPRLSARHFQLCAEIGRKVSQSDSSILTRMFGSAVLRRSGLATASDLEARRVSDWRLYALMQATKGRDDSRQFIEDLLATGSEMHAVELLMRREGVALDPPKGWTKETAVYPGLER